MVNRLIIKETEAILMARDNCWGKIVLMFIRPIRIILTLLCLITLTVGCTEEQPAAEKPMGSKEKIDIQIQAEVAFEILKEEKDGFDECQKVSLQKLDSRYYLAELLPEQARMFDGGFYYIVDTEERVITWIPANS